VSAVADPYYTIGEVLALLLEEFPDITISKIRFLESQGLITPERTSAGYRKFTKSEIERLRFILREQKDNFLPLRVIRDRLEGETSESLLRPEDVTDPSMPRGIRMPSSGHPTKRVSSERVLSDMRSDAGPSTRRPVKLSRADLLETTGIEPQVLDQLQKMKLVRPIMLGSQSFYDEVDRDIVHLAGRFAALGVEPRLLMAWRLAAEREADIIEPLVRSRASRESTSDEEAHKLLAELVSLAEDLRTALLRSAMRNPLTDS
jgi:DNA-binding transcriptional MerR regulator